jgi:hypothetical protein
MSSPTFLRAVLLVLIGCATGSSATHRAVPEALPVLVAVTNESGVQRRIELLVNNVVVVDTVVGRPINLTGKVLADTLRLMPGGHDLLLIDHLTQKRFTARLEARPGEMYIAIRMLSGGRTTLSAGPGRFLFM